MASAIPASPLPCAKAKEAVVRKTAETKYFFRVINHLLCAKGLDGSHDGLILFFVDISGGSHHPFIRSHSFSSCLFFIGICSDRSLWLFLLSLILSS